MREGHTGIIVSVSGNQFTTVEGNTGGTENCRTVGSHTWTFPVVIMNMCLIRIIRIKYRAMVHILPMELKAICTQENSYSDNSNASVVWNNRVKENIHPRYRALPQLLQQDN